MAKHDFQITKEILFKIPDPVTLEEFCRRTGKSESSARKLMDRRRLPLRTERQLYGESFSELRLMVMWNEWIAMIYEETEKMHTAEKVSWKMNWAAKAKKILQVLEDAPLGGCSTKEIEDRVEKIFSKSESRWGEK